MRESIKEGIDLRVLNNPEIIFNHISIEHAIKDFRLNTLIPEFNEILNRTTNICLNDKYESIGDIILHLDFDLVRRYYYLEEYNEDIYLVFGPILELNKFLRRIEIEESIIDIYPEEYREIERYSIDSGITLITFTRK